MRVDEFLSERKTSFEVLVHPPAFCATKLAKYLHVPGRQVIKSVLLATPTGYALAVLPATHRILLPRVSEELGGDVRLARPEELRALFIDCEPGALTPFGTLYGLPTLLDDCIPNGSTIAFESQTHALALRMSCEDFMRIEQPRRFRFAQEIARPQHALAS